MTFPIYVRASALIIQDGAVLLIGCDDREVGFHYSLPAGGVEMGEPVRQAVKREALEEAAASIEVGPLALVYEYVPNLDAAAVDPTQTLELMFACKLVDGSPPPRMPDDVAPDQVEVRWVKLAELPSIRLLPPYAAEITHYYEMQPAGPLFIAAD
jgi:ADP-ribose pyrophosphatase YjhB (NUDIX family)